MRTFLIRSIGNFFCDPEKPIRLVSRFRAQIVVFHITVPITKGFPVRSAARIAQSGPARALVRSPGELNSRVAYVNSTLAYYVSLAQAVVHYQMVNEPGYITKLVSILNKTTGEVLKNKPRCGAFFRVCSCCKSPLLSSVVAPPVHPSGIDLFVRSHQSWECALLIHVLGTEYSVLTASVFTAGCSPRTRRRLWR